MSKVWLIILLGSISALLITNPSAAISAMISGSHSAVNLAMELVALYAFWLGLFAIIEKIGIADFLARLMRPIVRFLFPSSRPECEKCITMNISANILGLGNASTPMAIRAISLMDSENGKASQNMIMMVVLSSTSLQLLPTTVIGMRATAGSVSPADFIFPCVIATIASTIIGISLVKLLGKLKAALAKKLAKNTKNPTRPLAISKKSAKPTAHTT